MWTNEWPDQEGWYWFFGDPFGKMSKDRKGPFTLPTQAVKSGDGLVFICNGNFLYSEESGAALWAEMEMPVEPLHGNTTLVSV